jgi:non-heme chloroperoxidase
MKDNPIGGMSRRQFISGSTGAAAAFALAPALLSTPGSAHAHFIPGLQPCAVLRPRDGTTIWRTRTGVPEAIVFSAGWPLDGDAWDAQMLFLGMHGYRVIARSNAVAAFVRPGTATLNTYADDVATLFDKLDLHDAVFVGHSTGGGEVTRYLGRHGTARVSRAVLIGAVPPVMLKSDRNPEGLPMKVFDDIRQGVVNDRSQFYRDLAVPFFGYNRPNAKSSQGVVDEFWLQGMLGGIKPQYDCIKAFSETDFTEDLRKIDIPVLLLHGDDDQIVPIDDSAKKSAKLLKKGTLKVIPGGSHGMCVTLADQINAALLEFIKG